MGKRGRVKISNKKAGTALALRKWEGHCKESFKQLGYSSVDTFVDDIRVR